MGNPIVKISRPQDRLIYPRGIPIQAGLHLYTESVPRLCCCLTGMFLLCVPGIYYKVKTAMSLPYLMGIPTQARLHLNTESVPRCYCCLTDLLLLCVPCIDLKVKTAMRLPYLMGIPTQARLHLYTESVPRFYCCLADLSLPCVTGIDCKDKMVMRSFHIYNEKSCTGKTRSWYWDTSWFLAHLVDFQIIINIVLSYRHRRPQLKFFLASQIASCCNNTLGLYENATR